MHSVGICHRDLKPNNILSNEGFYIKFQNSYQITND